MGTLGGEVSEENEEVMSLKELGIFSWKALPGRERSELEHSPEEQDGSQQMTCSGYYAYAEGTTLRAESLIVILTITLTRLELTTNQRVSPSSCQRIAP